MDRRTIQIVLVVAFGVAAIALAAATLTSTVAPETGGGGGFGGGGDGGFVPPSEPAERPADVASKLLVGETLVVTALFLTVLVATGYVLYRRGSPRFIIGLLAVIGVLGLLVQLLPAPVTTPEPPVTGATNASPLGAGNGSGGTGTGTGASTWTSVVVALLLGFGLIGAILVVTGSTATGSGASNRPDDAKADGAESDDAEAIGRAAGRAADRIASGDGSEADRFENEVYRAWGEMTTLLDVPDPDTTTPGEFETAAVDAGMAPEDVRELTRLFEDVRYGGYPPTGDREGRALRVFRRIESEYARDGP